MAIQNKGYQEGPLEDYLFTGILDNHEGLESRDTQEEENGIYTETCDSGFLEELQKLENNTHSVSYDKDYTLFEDKFQHRVLTLVLLTSQNAERISKRLRLLKDDNMMFKFENSGKICMPSKILSKDITLMHKQFRSFMKKASEVLRQS